MTFAGLINIMLAYNARGRISYILFLTILLEYDKLILNKNIIFVEIALKKVENSTPRLYPKKKVTLYVICAILVVALTVLLIVLLGKESKKENAADPADTEERAAGAETEGFEEYDLGNGIKVTELLPYTGPLYDDNSGAEVENVMAVVVRNDGVERFADLTFTLKIGGAELGFRGMGILPGENYLLVDLNRTPYSFGKIEDSSLGSTMVMADEPSLHSDIFDVSFDDGSITVTNVSGEDFTGIFSLRYKNYVGEYLCGARYSVSFEDGISANSMVEIKADHSDSETSKLIFIAVSP